MSDIKSDALRIILSKRRTEKQIVEALIKRGYPEDEAREAVSYYRENGYIDHRDYAVRFAHDAAYIKGFGPIRIARDLTERGVDTVDIDNALSIITFDILSPMERRFGRGEKSYDEIQKIYQHFMRKGFSFTDIKEAVNALYTYE